MGGGDGEEGQHEGLAEVGRVVDVAPVQGAGGDQTTDKLNSGLNPPKILSKA